jgi:hypothetical protein
VDFVWLFLTAVLVALSFGLIALCDGQESDS